MNLYVYYTVCCCSVQYFDLRKGAVGTYGYAWSDYDGHPGENRSQRCLELSVTRYSGGKIDPTNKTFTVNGNTTISKEKKEGGGEWVGKLYTVIRFKIFALEIFL